eukprot:6743025-Pyramimonas_sp.AAC.1
MLTGGKTGEARFLMTPSGYWNRPSRVPRRYTRPWGCFIFPIAIFILGWASEDRRNEKPLSQKKVRSVGVRCYVLLDRQRTCLQTEAPGATTAPHMIRKSCGNRPCVVGPFYGAGYLPSQSVRTSIFLACRA